MTDWIRRQKQKLRILKISDMLQLLMLPVYAVCAWFVRRREPHIWLILERRDEARDNGIVFFRYCMENRKDAQFYYVIDQSSADFSKLTGYEENVIPFGSFRHWVYYLACEANISSQKNSAPNDFCGFLFRMLNVNNQKIFFLQHGVTLNNAPFIQYNHARFRLMVCSAKPEYDFVSERFGYPADHLAYVGGLCRFDKLHGTKKERYILIAPTWRDWLFSNDLRMMEIEHTNVFTQSSYFRHWSSLLANPQLDRIAEEYQLQFIFYPHPSMQRYADAFKGSDHVVIADREHWDYQQLIRGCMGMITDYSSVFFDVVYMKRPVFFYQFDEEQFRKYQYPEGYFSYHQTPFGKWHCDEKALLRSVALAAASDFLADSAFLEEHQRYFPIYDDQNCSRTYDAILSCVQKRECP